MLQNIITFVNYYFPRYQSEKYNSKFIKFCLVYKFIVAYYLQKNLDMNEIIVYFDIYINTFRSSSPVITNYQIFSRAFKEFWNKHKKGRGCVYVFDSPFKQWELLGLITGITYWIFSSNSL